MKAAVFECEKCEHRWEYDLPIEMTDGCCPKCWKMGRGDWVCAILVDFKIREETKNE